MAAPAQPVRVMRTPSEFAIFRSANIAPTQALKERARYSVVTATVNV